MCDSSVKAAASVQQLTISCHSTATRHWR